MARDRPEVTANIGKHQWHLVVRDLVDQVLQLLALRTHIVSLRSSQRSGCSDTLTGSPGTIIQAGTRVR